MDFIREQIRIIAKGAAEIINLDDLEQKLIKARQRGRPLTVKLGLDPTAPDIHLGHTVVLRKIKQIQDLGHRAVIIIGDFTGMIGDPTGKSKTRKQLSRAEVIDNARTYEAQILKVLDREKTEIRFNSEWLAGLNFVEVMELASKCTVARILERDDFHKRFEVHESIGVHEFFYPLMQGYDSVALKADMEIGGTEQRFNILMGRNLQKDYGQESQVAVFMPLLEGTDGQEKMSKSLGNYIGINENPDDIYGKVMSIPDSLIIRYFELATDIHPDELDQIKEALVHQGVNPRDIKMRLAWEITSLYHGKVAADLAGEHFTSVFQRHAVPENIPERILPKELTGTGGTDIVKFMVDAGLTTSCSEAKRLIGQGAVRVNGQKIETFQITPLTDGDVIQVGKLKFIRVITKE
ncbi:MAG TPA: tyrosine--tRNA ligase [Bacillota bacterium]